MADMGSKFSHSTDEWSVERSQLLELFQQLSFWPTVDAFASAHNHVCDKFFSLIPQSGSLGVNFFAQNLAAKEKYFCCPPTKLAVACYRKLVSKPGTQAMLLIPEWLGSSFWPYFFNGIQRKEHIVSVTPLQARFFFTNKATSQVFTAMPKFRLMALLIIVPS